MKKFYLIALLLACTVSSAFSQSNSSATAESWQLVQETEGVQLYSMASTCGESQVLILKLVNTNESAVTVNVKTTVAGISAESPGLRPIAVGGMSSVSGSCSTTTPIQLFVLVQPGLTTETQIQVNPPNSN